MIAAGKGRRHRFTSGQLAIAGLAMVLVVGCKSAPAPAVAGPPPGAAAKAGIPSGMDTPIVISGGSIHFRARKSDWKTCDGSTATTKTTCYKATFDPKVKPTLINYQLVSEEFGLDTEQVTSASSGATEWEIDVVDTNPDNRHMILVCAESTDNATCDLDPSNSSPSNFIYVIAKGGGTFDLPKGPGKHLNRLVYHDGDKKHDYAYINNISLNASAGTGGKNETCTDSACILFLSK